MQTTQSGVDRLITQACTNPRGALLLVMLVVVGSLSVLVLLWCFPVVALLRYQRRWWLWLLGLGLILAVLAGWVVGMTPMQLPTLSYQWLAALAQGEPVNTAYVFLCTLPAGLIAGAFMGLLSGETSDVKTALKLASQGKRLSDKSPLPNKKRHRLLHQLNQQTDCPDGSFLGVDEHTGETVCLTDSAANLHTFVVGTTGAGKTTALANVIESVVRRGLPLVFIDGKGSPGFADQLAQFAAEVGRPYRRFSMMGDSLTYNPLAFGGYTSKKDRIIELRHWSEEHYKKIAEGYLQTVLKIMDAHEAHVDLSVLSHYLKPETLYLIARERKDAGLIDDIETLEAHKNDISSLVAEIDNMVNSEIGHLFRCADNDTIVINEVINDNAIAHFCLSPLAFPAYAQTLGKVIVNDIKSWAAHYIRAQQRKPVYVIIDEFSVLAGDQVVNLINQGREAGIHAILATQSLADIEKQGGHALLEQVIENCNNFLIMRQNSEQGAAALSGIIGTQPAYDVTSTIATIDQAYQAGSVRLDREFMIHPDDIKRLEQGEAIYVNKQQFDVRRIWVRQGMRHCQQGHC